MKKFTLILLTALLVTSLLISGTAHAQQEESLLTDPGITPDSPFYFFDTLGKNIGLFFAFGPEAKNKKALKYAEERLAETKAMATKNKVKEVQRAALDYDKFMAIAAKKVGEVTQPEISDNISERMALATSKHLAVLDEVREAVPEEAKEAIDQAKEASLNGQRNSLQVLAKTKAERATEINIASIEDRLNRASVKATENVIEEVGKALGDTDKLLEIEDEISEIAQGMGKDITPIEQQVANATANRLEVLARIYEKVPEQAKPAIENAMSNSIRKHERITEDLKKKNALGEIPEQAPLPKVIREEVRGRTIQLEPEVTEKVSVQERVQDETKERTESSTSTKASANNTQEELEEQPLRKSIK